jgi:DNA adenine methylase
MGSKSRIAKYIVPIIQDYLDKSNFYYYEPFCGGCNVIDKIKCNKKYASDSNEYLISLLQYIQNDGELPNEVPRELYSDVRSNPNNYEKWYVGAVGFLASYNGRFFDGGYAQSGYEGKRYRDYYQEAKRNLLKQTPNLKDIIFKCSLYQNTKPVNMVVYADPPYKNTKQFANSKNFNHELFWDIMTEWSKSNIVLVSELQAPDDWKCIWQQEVSRSIKSTDKSKAVEKLFIHKIKS